MNPEMVFQNMTGVEKHETVQYRSKFFPVYVHLSCFSPYFPGLTWLKAFILKVVEGLTLKLTKALTAKVVFIGLSNYYLFPPGSLSLFNSFAL